MCWGVALAGAMPDMIGSKRSPNREKLAMHFNWERKKNIAAHTFHLVIYTLIFGTRAVYISSLLCIDIVWSTSAGESEAESSLVRARHVCLVIGAGLGSHSPRLAA